MAMTERDAQVMGWLKEEFPIHHPKGSFERKVEENRRQVLIQRHVKRTGDVRTEWGIHYGPFYTHGKALEALRVDKRAHPWLYETPRTT